MTNLRELRLTHRAGKFCRGNTTLLNLPHLIKLTLGSSYTYEMQCFMNIRSLKTFVTLPSYTGEYFDTYNKYEGNRHLLEQFALQQDELVRLRLDGLFNAWNHKFFEGRDILCFPPTLVSFAMESELVHPEFFKVAQSNVTHLSIISGQVSLRMLLNIPFITRLAVESECHRTVRRNVVKKNYKITWLTYVGANISIIHLALHLPNLNTLSVSLRRDPFGESFSYPMELPLFLVPLIEVPYGSDQYSI